MKPLDELRESLARDLARFMRISEDDALEAVEVITEGWSVTRKDYPHRDDHPLAEVRYGHKIVATLPFVPETDTEREDREAWMAAELWTHQAGWCSWDPQDPGWDDDNLGPPPQRVGAAQLLKQGIWWRARVSDRPGSFGPLGRDKLPTTAIRLDDMTHDHRLALLSWLRQRAERFKLRADWAMASGPQPSGDMACDAFEDACNEQWKTPAAEWIEDQPLVQALAYWTTPYAESPLTWRPMNEAPRDGTVILARWAEPLGDSPEEQFVKVYWSDHHWDWLADEGSGEHPLVDELAEWRELRDDETTPFTAPERAWCDHGIDHCLDCEAQQDAEDANW